MFQRYSITTTKFSLQQFVLIEALKDVGWKVEVVNCETIAFPLLDKKKYPTKEALAQAKLCQAQGLMSKVKRIDGKFCYKILF